MCKTLSDFSPPPQLLLPTQLCSCPAVLLPAIGRRWLTARAIIKMNAARIVSYEANWFSISSPARRSADGFAWLRGLSGFISISAAVVADFRSHGRPPAE